MDKALMTDSELLRLVRSGDPSGLSFVYEKFRREFLSWIRNFCHCTEEEARELYQASVVIFYENTVTGRLQELQSSLKTYLFGIGKNLALQHFRKEKRMQQVKAEYILEQQFWDSENPEELEADLVLISTTLSKIGDPCYRLLELFYFVQKTMEEISVELGYKNPETTKNQKYKCMERLRKMVEEERSGFQLKSKKTNG